MIRRVLALIAMVSLLVALGPVKANAATYWTPKGIHTFQVQFSGTINTSVPAYIWDLDNETPASVVTKLHSQGRKAVCYVDIGGWENYRSDASTYPKSILGATVGGWPDERYVDVRQRALLEPILMKRFQACRAKGFDAVDTDLDSEYLSSTGFPLGWREYETFDKWVSYDIHSLGMAWFMKNGINGDGFIRDMQPYAQGAIVEECWHYGECGAMKPFTDAGKTVLNVEYTGSASVICPKARAAKLSTMRKYLSLGPSIVWRCW